MLQGYAYPSGHATLATSTYGFLAILLARDVRPGYRLTIYISASLLILLIAFSRLYLGAHWLTDVVGGMLLGSAWAALLGIAYRRHASEKYFRHANLAFIGSLLAVCLLTYPGLMHIRQLSQYQPTPAQYFMAEHTWLESGWQAIPSVRQDLRGHNDFIFNLQWMGDADKISAALEVADWQSASTKLRHYFNWFNSSVTINELPLLPHVHDGQYDELRFSKTIPPDRLLIIRLWRSEIEIQNTQGKHPLWFGYISQMEKVERFGLRYLVTTPNMITPLQWFQSNLPGVSATPRTLEYKLSQNQGIKQSVLLLRMD